MSEFSGKKLLTAVAVFFGMWLGIKYLLPLLLPFLFGAVIALAAEPAVRLGQHRLGLPRSVASGLGVTVLLVLLLAMISVLGAFLIKELKSLVQAVPDIEATAQRGMLLLQDFLVSAAQQTPEGVRPVLTRTVLDFFHDGTAVVEQVTQKVPAVVSSVISGVPDGALGVGTGILSAFFISGRLPKIKAGIRKKMPKSWKEQYLPALHRARKALAGWFKAQGKLALITYSIVTVGLLLLRVSYAPAWGLLVAIVDAVPLLGTGTVLVPWALLSFLQGETVRAVGLLCIFAVAILTRTMLEPRIVGRQLGIDPLLTLLALYIGYRFWGVWGMLIAPVLTTAAKSVIQSEQQA